MAIYSLFSKIEGPVTAKGYENHIEWDQMSFYTSRNISMNVGVGGERESDKPRLSEVFLTKKMDKATPLLFNKLLLGKAFAKVEIKAVKTSKNALEEYLSYVLEDVMIATCQVDVNKDEFPMVNLSLAYNKIKVSYRPRLNSNALGKPVRGGYDVKNGKRT